MRVNFRDGDSNCNGYVIVVIQAKAPFTLELELRAQTCNVQEFDTWIWQAFIQSLNYWKLD